MLRVGKIFAIYILFAASNSLFLCNWLFCAKSAVPSKQTSQ